MRVSKNKLLNLALNCWQSKNIETAIGHIIEFYKGLKYPYRKKRRGSWKWHFGNFLDCLENGKFDHYVRVFVCGNSKLPFYSFSTLPQITCPGAGDCLEWCYSFRAWRYPLAFIRQLQNSLLIKFKPHIVAKHFLSIPSDCDVRLYVDGDFDSLDTVKFWMKWIRERSDLRVYGYSKSWNELIEFSKNNEFPTNYVLNVSSGSKHDTETKKQIERLPISRGQFVAVKIDTEGIGKGSNRYNQKEYHARVRNALRNEYGTNKVFSCPGRCGECTLSGHACGNMKANNVVIGIGVH